MHIPYTSVLARTRAVHNRTLSDGIVQSLTQSMSVAANVLAAQIDVGARISANAKSPNLMCKVEQSPYRP